MFSGKRLTAHSTQGHTWPRWHFGSKQKEYFLYIKIFPSRRIFSIWWCFRSEELIPRSLLRSSRWPSKKYHVLCTSTLKCTLSPPTTTFQIWNHLHHNGKKHLHCGEKTKIPKTLLKDFWRTRGQPHVTQIQNVHLSQLQLLSDQLSFSNFQISSMYSQPSHSLPSVPLLL